MSVDSRPRRAWDIVRRNLFRSWGNALLSLLALWLIWTVLSGSLRWAFTEANWAVIPANLHLLMVGTYPIPHTWRVWLGLGAILAAAGLGVALPRLHGLRGLPGLRRALPWLAAAGFLLALLFIHGWSDGGPWEVVDTNRWGGLMLTLILATAGIALCFPLGVLLALGRRSSLPAVSWVSAGYIEIMRGVPLVGVLFMAQLLVPIFLPNLDLSKVVRAIIGFTLFEAAYVAENVRGGLQAIPRGQIEAAQALGLGGLKTTALIVLPQALRAVIPANVGQFISLFKDTSLVAILGLLDFLGIDKGLTANPKWLGLQAEVFCFAAVVYWLFTFSMSAASRRLEEPTKPSH